MEDQDDNPRGEGTNVQIHVDGGATLTFVHKHESMDARSHFVQLPTETSTSPFAQFARVYPQTAEEVCSTERSSQAGIWSTQELELCFDALVGCDEARCMHDLVKLLVSFWVPLLVCDALACSLYSCSYSLFLSCLCLKLRRWGEFFGNILARCVRMTHVRLCICIGVRVRTHTWVCVLEYTRVNTLVIQFLANFPLLSILI